MITICAVVQIITSLLCGTFGELNVVILHTGDMFSRFGEIDNSGQECKGSTCFGGFARLSTIIRDYRMVIQNASVLYLDAGGLFSGSTWYYIHRHRICSAMMNKLKPDAQALGNEEFVDGVDGLVPYVESVNFPVLSSNLDVSKHPKLRKSKIQKSVLLTVNYRLIGVIGYSAMQDKSYDYANVVLTNEINAINEECKKLEKRGAMIIIALGHSGLTMDKTIAMKCSCVDIVIGSHSFEFFWNGKEPSDEKATGPYPLVVKQDNGKLVLVVHAYAYTKYLGKLMVKFNDRGDLVTYSGQPIFITASIRKDPEVMNILMEFKKDVDKAYTTVLTKTKSKLEGSSQVCRMTECNFGNLLTDSFVAYKAYLHGGVFWTDAPIAILNAGMIRRGFELGVNITKADLMTSLPFKNVPAVINLTGSELLETIEIGVRSDGETKRGEFLQVSGLIIKVNMKKLKWNRVLSVLTRCGSCEVPRYHPLDPTKTYNVIVTDFLLSGGDGHTVVKKKAYTAKSLAKIDIDIIFWYLEKNQMGLYPEISERITISEEEEALEASCSWDRKPFYVYTFIYVTFLL